MRNLVFRPAGIVTALLLGLASFIGPASAQTGAAASCLEMAGTRSDGKMTGVEVVAAVFNLSDMLEAASHCSRAVARDPGDERLHEARALSLRMLKLMAFADPNAPDLEALGKGLVLAGGKTFGATAAKIYLAIAFEFGIGTTPSREAAMGWYRRALEDKVYQAADELARLERAGQN